MSEKKAKLYVAIVFFYFGCLFIFIINTDWYLTFFNIYLFLREQERERSWVGEGQGQRQRQRIRSGLQALNCQHRAQCWARTPQPWNHDLSPSWTLNQLSHPGAPILNDWEVLVKVHADFCILPFAPPPYLFINFQMILFGWENFQYFWSRSFRIILPHNPPGKCFKS